MRRTCFSSPAGVRSAAARRRLQQLRVGHRAPEEERQARREIEIGDCEGLARRAPSPAAARGGTGSAGWRASPAAPCGCRPRSRRPCGPARRTPSASARRRPRPARGRPASPGASGSRRRSGASSAGAVGRHEKTRAAARRVGHAGDLERAADAEVAQVRQRRDAEAAADLRVGQRVVDRGRRSSTGASKWCTNAAETRCGPALTWTRGVCRFMPFGSCSLIAG